MSEIKKKMKWIAYKGTVKCEKCGHISFYGYQDKDTLCKKCRSGFYRFYPYEVWETKELM